MDREPLGWTVKRHVVDVTFRELELPRPGRVHRYLTVGQASAAELIEPDFAQDLGADLGPELGQDFGERRAKSRVSAGGPSPAP
jgi:hypothetical protein